MSTPEAVAAWVEAALDAAPEPTEAQLANVAALLGLGGGQG